MDSIIQHYAMTHMLHGGENGGRRGRRMGEGGRMHHRSHILSSTRSRSRGSIDEDDDVSFFPSPFKGHRHALSPLPGYSANRFDDGMTLCMQLVDWEHFVREDPISEALMPVKKSQFENKPSFWPKPNKPAAVINKESRGEVNVSLCYSQTSKKLTVVILKARNLPRKDLHAYCDPYVKLCLMHNGNKLDKKKTAVRSQTSNPIFHECFTFIVSNEVIADAQLVVSALDFDFINNNRDIGHVVLGKNGSETGEKHWAEMVTRPGYPTAQWHTLMLNWY